MLKLLMKAIVTAIVVPTLICIPFLGWLLAFLVVTFIWFDEVK